MPRSSKKAARWSWRSGARSMASFATSSISDARLYLKMEEWTFGDNRGLENPMVGDATRCPDDCGLCNMHTSHTGLANVDLTNRCNLTCPVCFANANAAGYVYEPDFEHGAPHASGAARPEAGGRPHRAVLRRRADHLSALLGCRCAWRAKWASRIPRWPPTA